MMMMSRRYSIPSKNQTSKVKPRILTLNSLTQGHGSTGGILSVDLNERRRGETRGPAILRHGLEPVSRAPSVAKATPVNLGRRERKKHGRTKASLSLKSTGGDKLSEVTRGLKKGIPAFFLSLVSRSSTRENSRNGL